MPSDILRKGYVSESTTLDRADDKYGDDGSSGEDEISESVDKNSGTL